MSIYPNTHTFISIFQYIDLIRSEIIVYVQSSIHINKYLYLAKFNVNLLKLANYIIRLAIDYAIISLINLFINFVLIIFNTLY